MVFPDVQHGRGEQYLLWSSLDRLRETVVRTVF